MAYDMIEKLGALPKEEKTVALKAAISANERKLNEILKRLGEFEAAAQQRKAEEEAAQKAEEARLAEEAKRAAEEAAQRAEEARLAEEAKRAAEEAVRLEALKEAELARKAAIAEKAPEPVAPRKSAETPSAASEPRRPASPERPRPASAERKPGETRTFRPETRPDRPARPTYTAPTGKPQGDRRPPLRTQPSGQPRPAGAGPRPQTGAPRTPSTRPAGIRPAPAPVPAPRREPAKKFEKTYVEKARGPVNKRALQRQQGASIGDFDKESGYRKARFGKKARKETQTVKIDHAVVTTQEIPIKVLSEKLGISAVEITKRLFKEGVMKTVNESVDYESAAYMALEMGIDLEYKPEKTAEDVLIEEHGADDAENLVVRAPVVTVMGHVDHGKTSLLDKIRSTNVTEGEAGGITQSIGAYTVSLPGDRKITFIDTPGHAAFTAMRARGAQVTDIVVLVVAADDGIMPQTVEAIDHAKAADVPIIVAMNKMDKPNISPDKVKQGLMNYNLVPEEWGGDVIVVPVSAKTGEGIDELLESIYLQAEMQELRANPARKAKGVVIEAKLDKGKGPMASVLVQNGTLRTGDNLISGTTMGRVRAMIDDQGKTVKEAGPSTAVSILGLEDVPNAGDAIFAVDQTLMKKVQEERKNKQRESLVQDRTKLSFEDIFKAAEEGETKNLNVIIKADVQGSVEAVRASVEKLSNEEVKVRVIRAAAGAITESDVSLAESSKALILGFNVRPDAKAKTMAERARVEIRMYRIIYELLDEMEAMMKGMLAPKYKETLIGKAEVRQTFNVSGVGVVAGCLVVEGRLMRGGKLRIYRDNIMIVEGNAKTLKHYKDEVKEIAAGLECGCAIEGFNEVRIGDFIECYLIEEVKPA